MTNLPNHHTGLPIHALFLALLTVTLLAASVLAAPAVQETPNSSVGLRSYVEKPDATYAWKLISNDDLPGCKVFTVRLTSQTWRSIEWSHWLSIIVPGEIRHKDKAILMISGGSSRDAAPRADSRTAKALIAIAQKAGAVMAVVQNVPNQPLFGGKYEDQIIAMTFAQFIKEGEDWPLLLPMVKSAVKAMDATQAVVKEKLGQEITGFVVTGASKRGWTTWLTAATDKRVVAIAPMVIDVLNFDPQLEHQRRCYGKLSEQVQDYEKLELPKQLKTERGKVLGKLVDPFHYRDVLTMPKLIVLGTNDPYWTVDASSIYFPQLKGEKHLYYEPNAGHGLGPGIYPTMVAFFDLSMQGKPLPAMEWQKKPGGLTVTWKDRTAAATLWQATSATRDFRKAKWTATPLAGEMSVEVNVPAPAAGGWTAFYVELRFALPQVTPFGLCTEVNVVPQTLPFAAP
jgi:PhoPQ-activated pathogenicity-related protein